MTVEIGFGNGEYLEYMARRTPHTVVGIEVSQWCVTKAARRALAGGLQNVRLLLGDARYLLRYAFEPCSVREVYMHFPCPWPKRRHAGRRVTSPRFAELIGRCLETEGSFTLATDVEWYANETRDVFAANGNFDTSPVERNQKRDYITKYERKWRELGLDTFVTKAVKVTGESFEEADEEEANDLITEINLDRGALDLRSRLSPVVGETLKENGYAVIYRELFLSDDGSALISVISVDEGFEQHYYIKVVQAGGEARGKIDPVGKPYRTPGVRASLKHVARIAGVKF
jgi:tRNA (guanine-N7-)-methyltransferase